MVTIKARQIRGLGAIVVMATVSLAAGAADEKGKAKGPQKAKAQAGAKAAAAAGPKVSYDKQIRPIFQAQCQGCHQPAKAGGGYVMTAFDRMLKGGESDERGDRPGQARGEPSRRADHARQGRQGRDAPGQAAALGRPRSS